jgi:hypothetical protein
MASEDSKKVDGTRLYVGLSATSAFPHQMLISWAATNRQDENASTVGYHCEQSPQLACSLRVQTCGAASHQPRLTIAPPVPRPVTILYSYTYTTARPAAYTLDSRSPHVGLHFTIRFCADPPSAIQHSTLRDRRSISGGVSALCLRAATQSVLGSYGSRRRDNALSVHTGINHGGILQTRWDKAHALTEPPYRPQRL